MSISDLWIIIANMYIAVSFVAEGPNKRFLLSIGLLWLVMSLLALFFH